MDIKTQQSVYDHYDILEEIGTGAFGVVHRCREIKTGHVFAAKFIPISHAMEKALIRSGHYKATLSFWHFVKIYLICLEGKSSFNAYLHRQPN